MTKKIKFVRVLLGKQKNPKFRRNYPGSKTFRWNFDQKA